MIEDESPRAKENKKWNDSPESPSALHNSLNKRGLVPALLPSPLIGSVMSSGVFIPSLVSCLQHAPVGTLCGPYVKTPALWQPLPVDTCRRHILTPQPTELNSRTIPGEFFEVVSLVTQARRWMEDIPHEWTPLITNTLLA